MEHALPLTGFVEEERKASGFHVLELLSTKRECRESSGCSTVLSPSKTAHLLRPSRSLCSDVHSTSPQRIANERHERQLAGKVLVIGSVFGMPLRNTCMGSWPGWVAMTPREWQYHSAGSMHYPWCFVHDEALLETLVFMRCWVELGCHGSS